VGKFRPNVPVEVASAKAVFNAPAELLNILSIDCVDAETECAPPTCAVKGDWYELGQ